MSHAAAGERPLIYLFNLIVALEWEPNDEDTRELAWAFRRASDFLYDISDGRLAFGQVLIGTSADYLQVADIVFAASNRMQGRSWVAGIHEISKRMPVRLGRGDWRRDYCIPWDEPEAYRVLVHEWAHYALHLRDRYLVRRGVETVGDELENRGPAARDEYIYVSKTYLFGSSVMETLAGVSELAIRASDDEDDPAKPPPPSEIELLRTLYPSRPIGSSGRPSGGPGRLPLPLPLIRFQPMQSAHRSGHLRFYARDHAVTLGLCSPDKAHSQGAGVPYDQCWLYVASEPGADAGQRKLIAQGTLDMRAGLQPFTLLGASDGDLLIAVVYGRNQSATTFVGTIREEPVDQGKVARIDAWRSITFAHPLPIVTVLPRRFPRALPPLDEFRLKPPEIAVRVALMGSNVTMPTETWLCPLAGPVSVVQFKHHGVSRKIPIIGLDGHVVLWYGRDPFICTFSHGGNPPTHTPGSRPTFLAKVVPPITAGSSDGQVRMYFHGVDEGKDARSSASVSPLALSEADILFLQYYSHVRFVTTTHNGAVGDAPMADARPIGYPFSVACNNALKPEEVHTTLELHYATYERQGLVRGALRLCRLVEGQWRIVPTYQFLMVQAVARYIPESSPFYNPDSLAGRERVEHYQLWWVPS